MRLKFEEDIWFLENDNPSLRSPYRFDFNHFVSLKIKRQVKACFEARLLVGNSKRGSLARYCNAWRFFSDYLVDANIGISSLTQLSPQLVDGYMLFLNNTMDSSHTKTIAFASFKSTIRYGQKIGLPGYPKHEIFSGSASRTFRLDDELKTKEIPQFVLGQIDQALIIEINIYIKTAVAIARYTGLRLSEILCIEDGCVIKDFMDKPLLLTYSFKNDKDRGVPIPNLLANIINDLERHTRSFRLPQDKRIFVKVGSRGVYHFEQNQIRKMLNSFLQRHNIVLEDGSPAQVTFHQFRHTLGTQAMNLGLNPKEIMDMLGHESFHSTAQYAKVRDDVLAKDYRKIGFIGITSKNIGDAVGIHYNEKKVVTGALPDGICAKAFEGDSSCGKFNKCLLCPKFITTPEYLPIHKDHLRRLQQDKAQYMLDSYICNIEKVERIEEVLRIIIKQLEEIA